MFGESMIPLGTAIGPRKLIIDQRSDTTERQIRRPHQNSEFLDVRGSFRPLDLRAASLLSPFAIVQVD